MKTFARFRKAVGRGTAALRGPSLSQATVPACGSAPDALTANEHRGSAGTDAGAAARVTDDDRAAALALAGELLRSDHAAQGLEVAQTWIQRDPEDADFRRVAGNAQKALRWLKEAGENLEFVLGVRGRDAEILRGLGEIYDGLGQTAEAISRWEMLVELTEGKDVCALTALGIDLSRAGEHARAAAVLQTVASRGPGSSAAFADLGMALLEGGRINEAVGAFSNARALDPLSAQAHCGLGLAYQGLERWHEATEAFAETERLAPESAVGPFNLGLALAKLGDWKGTRHALLRAASIEPDDREIRAALERLFMTPEKGEEKGEVAAAASEPTQTASISGSLKTFHLLDLLEFLRIQAKTGTLVISSRLGLGRIGLLRGGVIFVSAPGTRTLTDELVARRLIDRAALDAHWATFPTGPPADDESAMALCTAGLVVREQLHQVRLDQAIAGVEELYGWKEGTFSFHPSEETGPSAPITFDLPRLVLEMLRRVDERTAGKKPATRPSTKR